MQNRTIARELALLILGQLQDRHVPEASTTEQLLAQAMASLNSHLRESLDQAAEELQQAQQALLDSELAEGQLPQVREHLRQGLERWSRPSIASPQAWNTPVCCSWLISRICAIGRCCEPRLWLRPNRNWIKASMR